MTHQPKSDRLEDFVGHVRAVESTLFELHRPLATAGPKAITDRLWQARRLVYEDLHELSTLLSILAETIEELRTVRERIKKFVTAQFSSDSPEGETIMRQFSLTKRAEVLIKAIYEWLYHLRENLQAHSNLRQAVSPRTWATLKKCCSFRNELITHRHKRETYSHAGTRTSGDSVDIELLLVPLYGIPPKAQTLLSSTFEEAAPHLPADKREEVNDIERIAILYRSSDVLPGPLQGRIAKLIHTVGAVSDLPLELGRLIRNLTAEFATTMKIKPATA